MYTLNRKMILFCQMTPETLDVHPKQKDDSVLPEDLRGTLDVHPKKKDDSVLPDDPRDTRCTP